jgi:uncharacterized protein
MDARAKKRYSWAQFEEDCGKIFVWAREKKFNSVYGIPRGGLVIAVKLSHLLNIPLVLDRDDITRQTLVVDDIADSGGTIERLKNTLGDHCVVATIYKGEHSSVTPDFFLRVKRDWIVFPWETDATSKYDGTI